MSVQVPRDPSSGQDLGVLALREALTEPAGLGPRQAEIVKLAEFGGLTEDEMATVSSRVTIRRDIAAATFWLDRRMKGQR
jgi:hypothetical protein